MCRFFETTGNCQRGESCSYAHGLHELNSDWDAAMTFVQVGMPPSCQAAETCLMWQAKANAQGKIGACKQKKTPKP